MKPSPHWDVAARTHVGRVRAQNEDSFVIDAPRGRFAVIDGMGGPAAGAVAAEHARIALQDHEDLFEAFAVANRAILQDAARNPDRHGMGCVVTAVHIHGPMIRVAHVGDTRAYVASEDATEQITQDHTSTAADQEAFGLSEAQARALPNQHQVTNDIGRRPRKGVEWIEAHDVMFSRGDVLLLCSDGLHDALPQAILFARLAEARKQRWTAGDLADRLLAEALSAGGDDNVTVVVVRRRYTTDQIVTALANPFLGEDG
ncbi:MAG: SpoIIE family protein phosphatase [Myxococcota bacterium]